MSGNGPKNVNNGTNFGQVGDNYFGKPPFELTEDLVRQVVQACPKGTPVLVFVTGSPRGFPMQARIMSALETAGFAVSQSNAIMTLPMPTRPLTITPGEKQTVVTISADA